MLKYENGIVEEKIVPNIDRYDLFGYLLHYTPNPTRVCVHKEVFNDFLFDPSIPGLEDLDLWLRIATKYKIIQLKGYTNIYFIHSNSYSNGETQRFKRELNFFGKIFNKKELRGKLPESKKKRLLSMCYFFLAKEYNENKLYGKLYFAIVKSFLLYPQSYNGKTNKILLVMFLYNIPIIGIIFQSFMKRINENRNNNS